MAFRKRNVAIQRAVVGQQGEAPIAKSVANALPGTRPSPLTGHVITSTGISSLDGNLGGHAGLVLGSSILIEETGTTDYSGTLLKFFAAEGIAQGHTLHIVGVGQHWTRELPGLIGSADAPLQQPSRPAASQDGEDKMKIAWRYERLGQHDSSRPGGVVPARNPISDPSKSAEEAIFCHSFDLAKRLTIPSTVSIHHIPVSAMTPPTQSPFAPVVQSLLGHISSGGPASVHRIVIPSLLSPAYYPSHAASPEHVLQFLHAVRAIQRRYSERVVMMATLPTELYPRSSGIVRWAEHLCDGVIELQPFPHAMDGMGSLAESGGTRIGEEQPQGMFKFHKLPALTERGVGSSGSVGVGDDLAFTLSRRKFVIRPFSLPPMEEEEGNKAQATGSSDSSKMQNIKKADIEF